MATKSSHCGNGVDQILSTRLPHTWLPLNSNTQAVCPRVLSDSLSLSLSRVPAFLESRKWLRAGEIDCLIAQTNQVILQLCNQAIGNILI